MKRILFVHQDSSVGGGSFCLLNMVRCLDKSIWEPVVMLKTHGPLENEIRNEGIEVVLFHQMLDIPYNRPLSFRMALRYFRVLLTLKSFEILLRKKKIEIVYLNNMMLAPYLKAAKLVGCKTVVHVREHWPLNEHKKQLEWVRNIVYKYCDRIIAINHYSASIFPQRDATIVYDWIDMDGRFKKMPMSEVFNEDLTGKKVLLFTGGSQYIKGADYVVNVFSKRVKEDEYRLLILGIDMNKPLAGWLHALRKILSYFGKHYYELELRELINKDIRIKCIPGVYELGHLIEQSYCFVSYFRMPHANLSLAENIIMGNPSIAAETEEAREYSGNGQFAMLVKPNSKDDFSEKLKEFLSDNRRWTEAAIRGSKTISEMFDKKNNIIKLHNVLDSLL